MAVAKKSASVATTVIDVPAMEKRTIVLDIRGTTPLITHRWSEKAKQMMRDTQQKAAKKAKAVRVPSDDFDGATYFISRKPEVYGFPVIAFKAAMVDAAVALGGKKTETRRAFHVVADAMTPDGALAKIISPERVMREDMVRVGMGSADLRYRPEFTEWSVHLRIDYDQRQISIQQLIALANQAGFSTGVGEWRPEKDGMNGMFEVAGIL